MAQQSARFEERPPPCVVGRGPLGSGTRTLCLRSRSRASPLGPKSGPDVHARGRISGVQTACSRASVHARPRLLSTRCDVLLKLRPRRGPPRSHRSRCSRLRWDGDCVRRSWRDRLCRPPWCQNALLAPARDFSAARELLVSLERRSISSPRLSEGALEESARGWPSRIQAGHRFVEEQVARVVEAQPPTPPRISGRCRRSHSPRSRVPGSASTSATGASCRSLWRGLGLRGLLAGRMPSADGSDSGATGARRRRICTRPTRRTRGSDPECEQIDGRAKRDRGHQAWRRADLRAVEPHPRRQRDDSHRGRSGQDAGRRIGSRLASAARAAA